MRIRRSFVWALPLAIAVLFTATASKAQGTQEIDTSWPREIESDLGKIIIYQPQLDSLDGNILTGRSAVSLQGLDKKEPIFGALWFRSEVSVDRDAGLMTLEDTKITRVKFPDATPEDMQKMRERIEAPANTWDIVLTLEQVETSLAASEKEVASTENLKSDPPVIIFSQKPAVLISFDGEPETRPIKDSPYEQVVNTAVLIVKDKSSGNFYLSNGQTWFIAKNPKGPWSVTTNTPSAIKDFVKPDPDAEPQTGPPPQIITATVPTELIVTSGVPNWTALTGNQLLYVSNTESTFIKEIATNKYYLLLSGRWFSSQSLDGPWTYERSDSLPTSFKQIPPASPVGDALAAVAGTNQAEDAEMDAEIPQTAAIKRDEAKTEVNYDGAPQFQEIPSTQVQYAVNTSSSVLKIGDRYYVCDNGVWFAGLTPTGPWAVADSVPDAVQTIPPSAPVYNVRYVHVYDATPQIVYVGYTPGYIGTYRYYGTVVYGTGYYYRPWIGPVYYYPRPYTWGFNVIYNPWTGGWGFALGYSTPFVNVSIGWRSSYYRYPPYWGGGGWWGPGGYRPIYRPLPGYRPPYYRPPNNVIIIRPGRPGHRPGYPGYPNRPGQPGKPGRPRPTPYTRDNIYARPGVSDRVKTDYRPKGKTPRPVTKLPNNVYTDKNGDVYRRNNTGKWDKRENGKWSKPAPANPGTQPTRPGTRPAPGTPGTKPAPTNPNTRPAPQPKPGQPSIQPVPNQPQPKPTPTNPNTRPAPQPKPEQPSIQPAPNQPQPKPTPTNPNTRPAPQPKPGQPSIQPAPNQPQPKPTQPSTRPTRPAPDAKPTTPTNPSIQPAPNNPSAQPSTRPGSRPSTPTVQPAPAPGLNRDADARNRSRTARPAPPPQRTAPPNNTRQSQPSNNSRNSSSNNQSSKSQNNKNQRQR